MAKSTTKNESTELNVEKIRRFTDAELAKIADTASELPFCYQIGYDVLVGRYRVVKIDEDCWRVVDGQTEIFDFFRRKDAIFYCIALHQKQHQLARDIREQDSQLNKLEFEAGLYRHRYRKANEQQDAWGAEYYSNRYTETMYKLARVKKELQKTLTLAKYTKV